MPGPTLVLAVTLTIGFAAAKLAQRCRLPSVTGYILAGVLLGPIGFGLIRQQATGHQLEHFSEMALMLIAFGIGEHLELRKLRKSAGWLAVVAVGECCLTFLVVALGSWFAIDFFPPPRYQLHAVQQAVLVSFLGAVSIATAPASTLHVLREKRAVGVLSSSLMQVVAINNGLAIMAFGLVQAIAQEASGAGIGLPLFPVLASIVALVLSLGLGLLVGFLIDTINNHLTDQAEMLIVGLALLLLGSEVARYLKLSPLLVGMAVGFVLVNRVRRDVRLFRLLNAFEPPILVLFFVLAGAHLDLGAVRLAGMLGVCYFFLRVVGKISGATAGAWLGRAPRVLQRYLGLGLIPQAGVAIGLLFLLGNTEAFTLYGRILIPTVLAGVLLAELIGPACTGLALQQAGEAFVTTTPIADRSYIPATDQQGMADGEQSVDEPDTVLVPWTWEKLTPAAAPRGGVLFGISHGATVRGLARMATLLAHHFGAIPMAARIHADQQQEDDALAGDLFQLASREAMAMGYPLTALTIDAATVAAGLVELAVRHQGRYMLLGYPIALTAKEFDVLVRDVRSATPCPVVLVHFSGILHTERILVPVIQAVELDHIAPVLTALAAVGSHRLTIMQVVPADTPEEERSRRKKALYAWAAGQALPFVQCLAVFADNRLERILDEVEFHDLVLMASRSDRLQKVFFGSLADEVVRKCRRPMLVVVPPA